MLHRPLIKIDPDGILDRSPDPDSDISMYGKVHNKTRSPIFIQPIVPKKEINFFPKVFKRSFMVWTTTVIINKSGFSSFLLLLIVPNKLNMKLWIYLHFKSSDAASFGKTQ